jgi:hypothetical protein
MSGAVVEPDATTARPTLRDRLLVLRAELRQRLAEADVVEPSWLPMLANAETVIAALDREGAA